MGASASSLISASADDAVNEHVESVENGDEKVAEEGEAAAKNASERPVGEEKCDGDKTEGERGGADGCEQKCGDTSDKKEGKDGDNSDKKVEDAKEERCGAGERNAEGETATVAVLPSNGKDAETRSDEAEDSSDRKCDDDEPGDNSQVDSAPATKGGEAPDGSEASDSDSDDAASAHGDSSGYEDVRTSDSDDAGADKKPGGGKAKPAHPKYREMIAAALKALKERTGSSRQAILKYILTKYELSDEKVVGVHLRLALRKGLELGLLEQVKGTGASGSFKLAKGDAARKSPVKREAPKEVKEDSSERKVALKTAAKKVGVKTAVKKTSIAKRTSAVKGAGGKKAGVAKNSKKKPAATKATAKKTAAKKASTAKTAATKKAAASTAKKAPVSKTAAKKASPATKTKKKTTPCEEVTAAGPQRKTTPAKNIAKKANTTKKANARQGNQKTKNETSEKQ
ncbi:histone H1E-like [Penaeus japonicus]|uniref:histone H1E-like n=1 Tax=Penaeus japonicus TaxID=27405 RepID=UPI001C70D853|nr:histone H1E-like [Penaeus japonicus]